ncbi:phosphatase PAP2 family protein [Streptomyces sp. NBC_01221]|uniref:phosphatase PAP2 family protein n=1 Tax=unclassified Streptomyces TaxID=2593676 RepID=UPI00225577D7|nr:phosphatase PAP2 family protein [Streptomyces sp. NBC_01221]MCX4788199.1 phosphatase PAP2 family protein [Streptomyces sp. NBC_01221]WSP56462.1 phosphatase PAP2 family protein [Streptomyces sp. NBC_01241]WSU22820.1 phosphatase PAP2 family protein [Streptomyces sp. NBC_01108]
MEPRGLPDAAESAAGQRSATTSGARRPTCLTAPAAPAVLFLLAFAALYLFAVWTPIGQSAENALVVGYADQARIFEWSQSVGPPPLTAEYATFGAGIALIAVVTLVRRCRREGCAAVGVAVVTIAATEALNMFVLPRPDLVNAPSNLTEASFPSGHVAIAAGLALGAVLVASPRARPYVAAAGALWLAVTAAAVQALYWHRPSDALGATLLACAAYTIATRLLPPAEPGVAPTTAPAVTPRRRALPALALVPAAVGALMAGSRMDAVARPLVFAGAAFVCAVLLWATATERIGRPAPRLRR